MAEERKHKRSDEEDASSEPKRQKVESDTMPLPSTDALIVSAMVAPSNGAFVKCIGHEVYVALTDVTHFLNIKCASREVNVDATGKFEALLVALHDAPRPLLGQCARRDVHVGVSPRCPQPLDRESYVRIRPKARVLYRFSTTSLFNFSPSGGIEWHIHHLVDSASSGMRCFVKRAQSVYAAAVDRIISLVSTGSVDDAAKAAINKLLDDLPPMPPHYVAFEQKRKAGNTFEDVIVTPSPAPQL